MQGVAETSRKLKDDEKQQVHHVGILATVSIRGKTKYDCPNGTEHEDQCDTPCDVGGRAIEGVSEVGNS